MRNYVPPFGGRRRWERSLCKFGALVICFFPQEMKAGAGLDRHSSRWNEWIKEVRHAFIRRQYLTVFVGKSAGRNCSAL